MKLLPSLKEKKRYLVLLIKSDKPSSIGNISKINKEQLEEKIKKTIDDALLDFLGVLGYAQVGPIVIETGKLRKKRKEYFYSILSVNSIYVDKARAAFSLDSIQCVGVSGTLRKVRRFL